MSDVAELCLWKKTIPVKDGDKDKAVRQREDEFGEQAACTGLCMTAQTFSESCLCLSGSYVSLVPSIVGNVMYPLFSGRALSNFPLFSIDF